MSLSSRWLVYLGRYSNHVTPTVVFPMLSVDPSLIYKSLCISTVKTPPEAFVG